ncbi:MAG: 4-hydroxy-3-methylbut-2-enyl diphosphate reductase [Paludibacteraceae bacterium]|nr:4-hydroxy-3-methylbut-2-enyl diphosphate reductase [Paludibacteraceae bacterium]
MQISIDQHSGFCFGVTRAIEAAESELANGPLYCLGDIVHNGQEVARLESKGLQTIDYDDLRTLPSHSRVLLRAHGEPPSTYWIAQQRGIEVIDATCPVVKKLQDRIRACYETHKNDEPQPPQIVIYGKPGHAEVIGLQGQTNNTAVVIENETQLDRLDFSRPIYLFSQTTKSVEGFNHLVEAISQRKRSYSVSGLTDEAGPTAERSFEYHDTICRNVANRVAELQAFSRENDIVLFVGGAKSSNAKVLFQKCVEANPNTLFISSPDELEEALEQSGLAGKTDLKVGICGATSTPLWLMQKVRDKLSLIP